MGLSNRDSLGDSARSPQCFHFAETVLLDHGPGGRLQSFETARRRLLHARTNSGRRDWWNGLRDGLSQTAAHWVSLDLSRFRGLSVGGQRDPVVAGARDPLWGDANRCGAFVHVLRL